MFSSDVHLSLCCSVTGIVVHLITQCGHGAYKVLQFLLDTAMPPPAADNAMDTGDVIKPIVQETCVAILVSYCALATKNNHLNNLQCLWLMKPPIKQVAL